MPETGTRSPCSIHDGRPLLQHLCAHVSYVHVANHRDPEASMLQVSADTQQVRNRWNACDSAGTAPSRSVQEVQGRVKGDHQGVGRQCDMGSATCSQGCQKGRNTIGVLEKALAGIMQEMKASQKSLERIAQDALEVSCEMLSQMTALVDLVELVVQGKRYVRMWEMGQLESDRESCQ